MAKKKVERENSLQMRVNQNEYEFIESRAEELGLQISNYMRMLCLKVDLEAANMNLPKEKFRQYCADMDQSDVSRTKTMQIRVSDEEFEVINQRAAVRFLSTSNYMRMICLHSKVEIVFNPMM